MAGSSSDSDSFLRSQASKRGPLRATPRRSRAGGAGEVTEKIHTLASTLQDTNRNLRHVDQMLGQYRDYTHEQTEAIATLKETLEQSIDQLRSQRLSRSSEMRSGASLSSLYASDLEGGAVTESRRFQPTSPLRDYGESLGTRGRRSRSASVRFVDGSNNSNQLHSLHQSLRDLSSDQLRLDDDIDRELARRNRIDAETKKTLGELSERLGSSQREDPVSERVERRLQELEREMRSERQGMERRQEQLGHMSLQLQEALRKRDSKADEIEASMKDKLLRFESEKGQLELELERARRKLDHSEGSREALLLQIDDLRSRLMKAENDRVQWQRQISLQSEGRREDRGDERRSRTAAERSEQEKKELEKQILELRAQLSHNSVVSEMEELRRTAERREREKAQLSAHIEVLTSDLEKREQQQLRMLEQLKDIQSRYEGCERDRRRAELQVTELAQQAEDSAREAEGYLSELKQVETLRLESEKRREEIKAKAQESIRQWKLKCKKLQQDVESRSETSNRLMDKNSQTELVEDKNVVKSQLWQVEKMKMEREKLTERLAQSEEESGKLQRQYQLMQQELDEKDRMMSTEEDQVQVLEEARMELRDHLRSLETEQESILKSIGSEIDAACKVLSRDSVEKLQAISNTPELQNDPHRWLAETKTKLQWLCEEAKEREGKERRLRRHLQQSREQLKDVISSKDADQQSLLQQIAEKEQRLEDIHRDKKDLLEKTRRQDEEMRALQDRIVDLEMSTRVALDHLESVPDKLNLLEDFKDLGETHREREMIEERYAKYREIVGSLQQQLEDSKRRIEEYRDEKLDMDTYSTRLKTVSSSLRGPNSFLSSSLLSDVGSKIYQRKMSVQSKGPHILCTRGRFPSEASPKRVVPLGFDALGESSLGVTVNGTKS
ncbi:centrosomal protein of 128 kDa isoform X6 [Rhinatrema bivittatum]|uniref:centrosomal protein of 128 kDa isoform X6 n=1 Tax=Rhinatrema bivittatum TaxID=194408 RepID=UPI00112EF4FD|nr:centrosomal protein of 128 kDa isoform X6 [Rhinatrema bivittatum]